MFHFVRPAMKMGNGAIPKTLNSSFTANGRFIRYNLFFFAFFRVTSKAQVYDV